MAIYTDQVARPQKLTDAGGSVVHDRVTTPFGERVVSLEQASLPLAFPGQREDEETGLSYNWHRDYDPALGRYVQSDPIGLAGGLNTYGYVAQNPASYVDPMGLDYVPPGQRGHGNFNGSVPQGGWVVADAPPENPHDVICYCSGNVPPDMDADFYYDPNSGLFTKIRDGNFMPGQKPDWNLRPLDPSTTQQGQLSYKTYDY